MLPRTSKIVSTLLLVLLLGSIPACAQNSSATNQQPSGEDIIPFLDQTVIWYRQLNAQQQLVSAPSDVLFLNDNRQVADQVVKLSFDFARSRAQALGPQAAASTGSANTPSTQYQRLADASAKADQQVKQSMQELDGLRRQLETATGKKRLTLKATIAETESELQLFQARSETMHNMLQIVSTGGGKLGSGSLQVQIEELARTVPAATDAGKPSANSSVANAQAAATPERKEQPTGILALISQLFALHHRVSVLDDSLKLTDGLVQSAKSLRAPIVAQVRDLVQKGNEITAEADSADTSVLAQERQNLDSLTAQYKQASAALMPLGRQSILLEIYRRNTTNWRSSVNSEYQSAIKGLLLRLGGLGIILGVVLGIAELSRRATFRYITDSRRRNQFMVLRRIVLWSVIALIIAIAFASELGAITTFAGLLTAGIAVALQNVILSIAGYFFLIGKYGVRVGDRVQVAGITGDVVDIGLIRLHLIEVAGGTNPRATGRAVVFSNSVVFQAGAGLFKQIPGTSFVWHEITITLGPENNYHQVEQRILDAVNKICAGYSERLENQRRFLERSMHTVNIGSLTPESRLRLTPTGIDVVVRYPVDLAHASEIDDQVTREVLEAINREPKLRLIAAQIEAQSA